MALMVPVSWGEFYDKLTILQIKKERIDDAQKLNNISRELSVLSELCAEHGAPGAELEQVVAELRAVNEKLWDIEDDIRSCERSGDFGTAFVELARSVYVTNDLRAQLKYRINMLLGSDLVEEKSYEAY